MPEEPKEEIVVPSSSNDVSIRTMASDIEFMARSGEATFSPRDFTSQKVEGEKQFSKIPSKVFVWIGVVLAAVIILFLIGYFAYPLIFEGEKDVPAAQKPAPGSLPEAQ